MCLLDLLGDLCNRCVKLIAKSIDPLNIAEEIIQTGRRFHIFSPERDDSTAVLVG